MGGQAYWTEKYRDNEENVIITLTGTQTNHGFELMTIKAAKLIVNEAVSLSAEIENPNVDPDTLEMFKITRIIGV